jgi:hypothetical protein
MLINEGVVMIANSFTRGQAILPKEVNYFRNLDTCISDAQQAALDGNPGPGDPINYRELQSRLIACRSGLPPLYRENVLMPYIDTLGRLGETGFDQVLLRDPMKEGEACLMLDIAQSILQHGEGYNKAPTDAFQEVVSDLYDGFLSAEDRRGIKPPDLTIIAPLVKWGNPESGPYTWPADATIEFGVKTAIVNLPPANAEQGIFAWAAIGHETAGHDIIHADRGLLQELGDCLFYALQDENAVSILPDYWASRIDETASDVLGILNMGPATGIALVGYFRALNAAYAGKAVLRNVGPDDDPHPADILRGYVAASVVRLLNFGKADKWATAIEAETDKDLTIIQLGSSNNEITSYEAKRSASIVASCLVQTKMKCLDNHAFGEIQNWHDSDEEIVKNIRSILRATDQMPEVYDKEVYAAHVVAAAIVEALMGNTDVAMLFLRMISILKTLHDRNPSWGPLYISHPGNMVPLAAYIRGKH